MISCKKWIIIKRAILVVLFIFPIAYVAEILAVTIHEVLGHGLSAVVFGGSFSGFVIKDDAMGWAFSSLPSNASHWAHILYLGSGVIATTVAGLLFLWGTLLVRDRAYIHISLLLLSFMCMMDGIPYLLWNSYHPVPPGDLGKIIAIWRVGQLPWAVAIREIFLVIGCLLFCASTAYFYTAIFARMETLILDGGQFCGPSRLWALLLLLGVPGAIAWFTFDWNQLAPGVGILPCVVGALSVLIMAFILFWFRLKMNSNSSVPPPTWKLLAASWGLLAVTVVVIEFWLQHGVTWG